jgi:hypothetical protein
MGLVIPSVTNREIRGSLSFIVNRAKLAAMADDRW